jgi:AbrB family looped-hinge helix DNA binding protein
VDSRVRLGKAGRVVIPARVRKALDLAPGDELTVRLEDGEVRLIPLDRAVALAQARVRKYVPEGTSLVDELIAARRVEAERE